MERFLKQRARSRAAPVSEKSECFSPSESGSSCPVEFIPQIDNAQEDKTQGRKYLRLLKVKWQDLKKSGITII